MRWTVPTLALSAGALLVATNPSWTCPKDAHEPALVGLDGHAALPEDEESMQGVSIGISRDVPAVSLQGHGVRVPGSPVPPPSPAIESSDDPWLQGTTATGIVQAWAATLVPPPPPPTLEVYRTRIAGEGTIDLDVHNPVLGMPEAWTVPSADDGHTLRRYDIAPILPAGEPLSETLRGHGRTRLPPSPSPWWRRLVLRIRDAVGVDRWDEERTLLATDRAGQLLVRQDARGHERLTAVLNSVLREQRSSVLVEVARLDPRRRTARETLRVDVPWACVRAHRGSCTAYLCDYDVRTGMGWEMAPLAGVVDSGLAVCARRVVGAEVAEPDVELEITWSGDLPRFEVERTSLFGFDLPLDIELVQVSSGTWSGRLPARTASHLVVLDDGTVCQVSVGVEQVPGEPEAIVGLPPASATGEGARLLARLTDERDHAERWGVVELSSGEACGSQWLHADWSGREICGPPLVDTSECDEGTWICVRTQRLVGGALVADVELRIRREAEPARRVQAKHHPYGSGTVVDTIEVDLPRCRVEVLSRRLVIPPSGATSLPLEVDVGDGARPFTLTLNVLAR